MTTSLSILFLSNRGLLPIIDGHTRRSFNILKGLSKYNRIYFLSLYENSEEISEKNMRILKRYCQYVEFFPGPKKTLSFQMVFRVLRSMVSLEPYTIWRHYSHDYKMRVHELIQKSNFDIIHCDILPIAYTLINKKGIIRSITNHDVSYLKCMRMAKTTKNIL